MDHMIRGSQISVIRVIRRIQKIRHRILRSEVGAGSGYGSIIVESIEAGSGSGSFDENLPDPDPDPDLKVQQEPVPDLKKSDRSRSRSRILIPNL